MPPTQISSAILLILFNRPDTTARVFEKIRAARPPRLYIAGDGPRETKPSDTEACRQARAAAGPIDWPCKVETLFREKNLGCKEAVSSAIDWFFQHEEEGIVLEDDCLPSSDFFHFCDTLLAHHRHSPLIRHICGCNFQFGQRRGDAAYYYSRLTHVWGWASWRRAWQDYDKNLTRHPLERIEQTLAALFEEQILVEQWRTIAAELKEGRIDTWDYQLSLTNFLENGLCIIPNANLITNIGFGPNSTHTLDLGARNANIPTTELGEITHPTHFTPDRAADFYTMSEEFQLERIKEEKRQREIKHRKLKYRLKRWFAGFIGHTERHKTR